jgi:hypothetical protein
MRASPWSSMWAVRDFTRPWGRCVRSHRICKACFRGMDAFSCVFFFLALHRLYGLGFCFFRFLLYRHFAVEPQPDGSYFIDRSSKWFSVILDYLRTRRFGLDIYDMKRADRIEFQAELEFYGLGSLFDFFQGVFVDALYMFRSILRFVNCTIWSVLALRMIFRPRFLFFLGCVSTWN